MSDTAIHISNLGKMHKLFKTQREKVMDAFGLGKLFFWKRSGYQEFWPLRNVSLTLKKGERVGIIGRNGAGKSTLLKIITGNVAPTEGEVTVNGKVQALMELGTGFHPEFTGRQNIRASLAYQGLEAKKIAELEDDIVEFAEIGNFIDQPIKTYSAGMYARLAFSVATALEPEILIIDEVLGAGDAYFASKCLERMKKLTEDSGATVLFVSHDLASVQQLCKKVIWVERGSIKMEGDPLTVIKSYTAAIREQEEKRLKAKNLGVSRNSVQEISGAENVPMLFHIINDEWRPFAGRHPFRKIALKVNSSTVDEINVGGPMDNDVKNHAHIITEKGFIDWSEPTAVDGGHVRVIENLKGKYSHAAFILQKPYWVEDMKDAILEIEYKDISEERLFLEYYDGERYRRTGHFENADDGRWKTALFDIKKFISPGADSEGQKAGHAALPPARLPASEEGFSPVTSDVNGDVYGTSEVTITKVQLLGADEKERYVFTSGAAFKIRVHYMATEEVKSPVFVTAIYRSDGLIVNQAISSKDGVDFERVKGPGIVDVIYDPILIGKGDYVISVAIFHNIDFLSRVESTAYSLHDRKYHFKVVQPEDISLDLGIVNHPVQWAHKAAQTV